jgi:hypothetical protein
MPRSTLVEFLEIHGRIVASLYCAAACAALAQEEAIAIRNGQRNFMVSCFFNDFNSLKELDDDDGSLIHFLKVIPATLIIRKW